MLVQEFVFLATSKPEQRRTQNNLNHVRLHPVMKYKRIDAALLITNFSSSLVCAGFCVGPR